MRHKQTKELMAYYRTLTERCAGDGAAEPPFPERIAVDPSECRALLGDIFILEMATEGATYRLAGTRLCALLGGELRGLPFGTRFCDAEKRHAQLLAATCGRNGEGRFACLTGTDAIGREIVLETLLLPLNHQGESCARLLGLLVACRDAETPIHEPVEQLRVRAVRTVPLPRRVVAAPALATNFPVASTPASGSAAGRPALRLVKGGREDALR